MSVNAGSSNETRVAKIISKVREIQKKQGDWLEETRGILMLVATVIATMTFQVSLAPPGGFWQQDSKSDQGCPESLTCTAGTSVLAYKNEKKYHEFLIFCTISFSSSLGIILFLISGLPLKNKFTMSVLILTMCTTVIFMAVTYMTSIELAKVSGDQTFEDIFRYYRLFWFGLLAIIIAAHTLRLILWLAYYIFIWPIQKLREWAKGPTNKQSGRSGI